MARATATVFSFALFCGFCFVKLNLVRSQNSPEKCSDWMFKCANGHCIASWWKCDGIPDCSDESDELDCGANPAASQSSSPSKRCSSNQFECEDGGCIWNAWVCDGDVDCSDGSDETPSLCNDHDRKVCSSKEFRCSRSGECVDYIRVCDGVGECEDGSDEVGCGNVEVVP